MKSENRILLEQQGYCVVKGVLAQPLIEKMRVWSHTALANVSDNHRVQFKSQGSLVDISDYPDFSEVIGHQVLAALFESLNLGGQVFSSGSIISKPAFSPSLFWHQDWWGWDDLLSYTDKIPQINIMIYLTPTTQQNGCLRVIPGSHHQKHEVHEIPVVYDSSMSRVETPDHVLYQSWAEEQAITVQPGDIVIKDARLLHGSYANTSDKDRTLVSLNFNPDFSSLPASMQSRVKSIFMRGREFDGLSDPNEVLVTQWPDQHRQPIEHLLPTAAPNVPPQSFNFSPNGDLLNKAAFS